MLNSSHPNLPFAGNQELFRKVFEEGPLGMTLVSPEGIILEANDMMCSMLGYGRDELRGCSFTSLTFPDDLSQEIELTRQLFAGEIRNFRLEKRVRHKSGNLLWIALHASVIRDPGGSPMYGLGMVEDVTERKQTQEALVRSEALWRSVFDSSAVGIGLADPSGRLDVTNAAYQQMTGYSDEELHSLSYLDVTHEDDREVNRRLIGELRDGTRPFFDIEKRYLRKDGSFVWAYVRTRLVAATENLPAFTIGIAEDITERKNAERELKRKNEILEKIFDQIPVMIHFNDENGELQLINEEWRRKVGWSLGEIRAKSLDLYETCFPDPEERQAIRDFIAEAKGEWRDFRPRTRNGSILDTSWAEVRLSDGTTIGIGVDITERKRAEAALRESEQRFRQLAENIREVFWINDPREQRVLYVSPAYEQIWGRSPETIYRDIRCFAGYIHHDDRPRALAAFERQIRNGERFQEEYRILRPDGTVRWIWDRSFPILDEAGDVYRFVGIAEDITDRKLVEQELQRSFEQLRALAAGLEKVREEERTRVAREIHDELGQALTAIKIELSWLGRRSPADGQQTKRVDSILALVDDTIGSVRRISTELRPGVLDDLGLVAAIEWASRDFERRTGTTCLLDLPETNVRADRETATAIFRIFQETLTNVARHAQASRVRIRMREEHRMLLLEIQDNGIGFDKEGSGSHSVSLGILGMRERALLAGGTLDFESAPGQGVTVRVRIPVAPNPERGAPFS
ncbi:MAG TPA: PAS domain S-box protein [Bryobacteraceae bacterium]|nr:PAS domain S-box protein [Bryobacteraceae bacterium]